MANTNRFVSATPLDGWSVDNRGYIHGGFETPEFLKVKRQHNSRLTENKRRSQEDEALEALRSKLRNRPTEEESLRLLREKLMGQPNHLIKEDSNA